MWSQMHAAAGPWAALVAAGVLAGAASRGPAPTAGGDPDSCGRCHEFDPLFSHPVDVYPSMRVPEGLPLQQGRVTCVTCHAGLGPATGRGHAGGAPPAADGDLCAACHDARPGRTGDLHALATRAHLARSRRWSGIGAGPSSRPDPESEACLACHDGALARAAPTRTGAPGPASAARLFGGRHPIGVLQHPRGAGDTLRHPDQVDPAVRLFDGRVGCGSCHSPYAPYEHLLVMSNHRSALCLACHDF